MSQKGQVMAIVNQKGGVGKTVTTQNLGTGLSLQGKTVLMVDFDPQSSLSVSCIKSYPSDLDCTVGELLEKVMTEHAIADGEGVIHTEEAVDLIAADISLAGLEVSLVNMMSRETILKQFIDSIKDQYDYILIDCSPSLGMLTINALAAADSVIIPVQPQFLSAKGLEQLLQTINKVKRQINPKLRIEGILLTMVDGRTNNAKEITNLIRETYGGKIKVFTTEIPRSVRAEETSAAGESIFKYDPGGKVAEAYGNLTKEVLDNAEKRRKARLEQLR